MNVAEGSKSQLVVVVSESCILDVLFDIVLGVPFYSSKGRPRLQGVGV